MTKIDSEEAWAEHTAADAITMDVLERAERVLRVVEKSPIANPVPSRKIAIFGTTPSRMEGPVNGDGWDRWTIGPGGKDTHGWDRLFEIHGTWPEDFKGYLNDLSKEKRAVYTLWPMTSKMEEWAHGKDAKWLAETIQGDWSSNVVIDREALYEKYGRMWFSSSIAYCIALAIEEGATDIGCWGIDLESGEEYISQHMGCKHFLDLAKAVGINLHFPDGCGLMRDLNPYPDRYETHLALTLEKKHKWLGNIIAQKEPEYENLKADLHRQEGALLCIRNIVARAGGKEITLKPEELAEEMKGGEAHLNKINQNLGQAAANINHLKGEQSATQYYRRMYCWGVTDPT
jgi:hypothetical protein